MSPQVGLGALPDRIGAERREERARTGQLPQLNGSNTATAGSMLEYVRGMHDVPGSGNVRDLQKLDPLDMAHHPDTHLAGAEA
jgi:hypothetical protein